VRYMVWREASNQLKAALTDGSYAAQIAAYKEADVLYIDDLFKTSSTAEVSGADVRLAFEILDYRARNQMLTILSTEWLLPQLRQIDGAIGGRIIQMSRGYAFEIRPDNQKDYRLRK
jgi:DNA replication protein DnaC